MSSRGKNVPRARTINAQVVHSAYLRRGSEIAALCGAESGAKSIDRKRIDCPKCMGTPTPAPELGADDDLSSDHDVLGGVIGLDVSDIEGLSRWQRVALALEVISRVRPEPNSPSDSVPRRTIATREQQFHAEATRSLLALRAHYD